MHNMNRFQKRYTNHGHCDVEELNEPPQSAVTTSHNKQKASLKCTIALVHIRQ